MNAIAIVGATSQIAKDLICSFVSMGRRDLLLYVRNLDVAKSWLVAQGFDTACSVHGYETYGHLPHDVVINFVGVGDPQRAAEMGAKILDITRQFDEMVLAGLIKNPSRRYIFISSGAVYGNSFYEPVTSSTQATFNINEIRPQDYYAVSKMHAEVLHRSRQDFAITDLRVFNMISRTQNLDTRFFVTDIIRAIRDNRILQTSKDYMVRDFMHPSDFHRLVECLMAAPPANCAVDCYSREPIDKPSLLQAMTERFGLQFQIVDGSTVAVNATGAKPHYYSLNRKAAEFGYQPVWSSLEGVLNETTPILS